MVYCDLCNIHSFNGRKMSNLKDLLGSTAPAGTKKKSSFLQNMKMEQRTPKIIFNMMGGPCLSTVVFGKG